MGVWFIYGAVMKALAFDLALNRHVQIPFFVLWW